MHSMASGLAFFTIIERRASLPANGWRISGNGSFAPASRWFGTSAENFANQKYEICVSTSPLRGMPLGMITSKAERRSVATNSKRSPRSKTSRTLPLLSFLTPGKSSCRTVSLFEFAMCGNMASPARSSKPKVAAGSADSLSAFPKRGWVKRAGCPRSLCLRLRQIFDRQRNARLRFVIEPDIHGIQPSLGEFQLLDVHDEIARGEMHVVRQRDHHRDFDGRHDAVAVGVDEVQLELARALVASVERDAQRDGALRMHGGQLRRVNRVERAEEIELAVVLGRGIAEDRHLNVHAGIKTRISRIGTNFFCNVSSPCRSRGDETQTSQDPRREIRDPSSESPHAASYGITTRISF